jgi:glycosyltransferase involved in cell wall biosynthesis
MKIEFIIPTFERTNHLIALLGSLMAQTNPNWMAHIIADCPDEPVVERLHQLIDFLNDKRIKLTILDKRYNDWGHTPRNIGLDMATEDWIIMTGEDNYYVPTFVDEFLIAGKKNETQFIYCNMVHNLATNSYLPIKSKIELGWIDIGCAAYMNRLIKNLRLETTYPESDYTFISKYLISLTEHFMPITKIDKVLYVHN